jgi:hypothetical protein
MALSDQPAERHRQVAASFTDRVRGTRCWDAPSPVEGWVARDVVRHLTDWFPAFLAAGAGVEFMHTWDLARATGQHDRLDENLCARLVGELEQMEQVLRASGQFGARVEVPVDADAQTRMLGLIGRDPSWSAPFGRPRTSPGSTSTGGATPAASRE